MTTTVKRRHVFFLSGFDPKGASYYHGLYRSGAAQQAAVTGARYDVAPRERRPNGNTTWEVRAQTDGHITETTYEYVRWDDIVRAHWPRSGWQVLLASLRGLRSALASPAALRKVWRASRRTLVALAYPAVYWLLAMFLAAAVGTLSGWAISGMAPRFAAWGAAFAAVGGVWRGALAWEKRLNTTWLLRIYHFAGDWRDGRVPGLAQRLQELARDIDQRLADPDVDEVLLVGFSVGSMLAVSAAARVQELNSRNGRDLQRLTLLTLGQCVPLLGLMAGADAFRSNLARLGQAPQLRWVDFSSVTDWGSFALVDPIALCLGPSGAERPYAPCMASPRFHVMFEPQHYRRMVRNKRRMHMQYLMAGQRPALYDYFAITAGPVCLAERITRLPAS